MGLSRKLLIVLAAAATAVTSVPPAMAMPLPPVKIERTSDIETVQYSERRYSERRWHHRPRHGWYGGHRGYRHHRHGYRRHSDGWWYPLAAFGAGAVIGGAIANSREPRVVVRGGGIDPRHYDWCSSRYRTYRASDNMYVPYVGALAECRSPYY